MTTEASFTGTLRVILILLVLLWVVRLLARGRAAREARGPQRPVGDVRIEDARKGQEPGGRIVDADYEEIK